MPGATPRRGYSHLSLAMGGIEKEGLMLVKKNDRGFNFLELVSRSHDHKKERIWIHYSLIEKKRVHFPIRGAWIYETKKGNLVIRPRVGSVVYLVTISSGYRGWADIEKCSSHHGECLVMAAGHEYHSPQGALGATAWALVNSDGPIEVYGERSGRRVSNGRVAYRLTPDGEREDLIEDLEVCDLLE